MDYYAGYELSTDEFPQRLTACRLLRGPKPEGAELGLIPAQGEGRVLPMLGSFLLRLQPQVKHFGGLVSRAEIGMVSGSLLFAIAASDRSFTSVLSGSTLYKPKCIAD